MASLDSVLTRQALTEGRAIRRSDDQSVAIRLYYVGGGSVTSVTVDNTTEDYELITVAGGTTYTDTFLVSAYTTLGALADAISATGRWEAHVMDALRSSSTDDTIIDGAVTVGTDEYGNVCWDLLTDTSANLSMDVCITPRKGKRSGREGGHRVHLQEIYYGVNVGTAAVDSVQVYLRDPKTGIETKVFSALSVDTTATTVNWASGNGKITAPDGYEIIARVKDAASVTGYIQVVGQVE